MLYYMLLLYINENNYLIIKQNTTPKIGKKGRVHVERKYFCRVPLIYTKEEVYIIYIYSIYNIFYILIYYIYYN